jgi:hypothetical protein
MMMMMMAGREICGVKIWVFVTEVFLAHEHCPAYWLVGVIQT